jgi:hypothetical protein
MLLINRVARGLARQPIRPSERAALYSHPWTNVNKVFSKKEAAPETPHKEEKPQ